MSTESIELQPRDAIEFTDLAELPAFEDIVAAEIDPDMTPHQTVVWESRPHIKNYLRPPEFNGPMLNVRLEVMDDPYARLLDARKRGWRFVGLTGTSTRELKSKFADRLIPRYRGFKFTADAHSSGKGTVAQVQSEMWYYPVPLTEVRGRVAKNTTPSGGASVIRVLTRPQLETENFINLHESAKRIGFSVLRYNLSRPLVETMRD